MKTVEFRLRVPMAPGPRVPERAASKRREMREAYLRAARGAFGLGSDAEVSRLSGELVRVTAEQYGEFCALFSPSGSSVRIVPEEREPAFRDLRPGAKGAAPAVLPNVRLSFPHLVDNATQARARWEATLDARTSDAERVAHGMDAYAYQCRTPLPPVHFDCPRDSRSAVPVIESLGFRMHSWCFNRGDAPEYQFKGEARAGEWKAGAVVCFTDPDGVQRVGRVKSVYEATHSVRLTVVPNPKAEEKDPLS